MRGVVVTTNGMLEMSVGLDVSLTRTSKVQDLQGGDVQQVWKSIADNITPPGLWFLDILILQFSLHLNCILRAPAVTTSYVIDGACCCLESILANFALERELCNVPEI